jgi:hypothetical protein
MHTGLTGLLDKYNQRALPFLCYISLIKKEENQMKTKKIVVGAIAASMLSLSVCSVAPAVFAAGEKVQLSASNETAEAGEKFTVEVSLADIPSTNVSCVDFSIKFDNSVITLDEVSAGPITKAASNDPSASQVPLMQTSIDNDNGSVSLLWVTMVEDSSYWIKEDGVFCTISGTVKSNAAKGASSKIELVPTVRKDNPDSSAANETISVGYLDGDAQTDYQVSVKNGSVTVGEEETSGLKVTMAGDANCDTEVNMSDVVMVMQACLNPKKYGVNGASADCITEQGVINGDVDGKGGLTPNDALVIQRFTLGLVNEL